MSKPKDFGDTVPKPAICGICGHIHARLGCPRLPNHLRRRVAEYARPIDQPVLYRAADELEMLRTENKQLRHANGHMAAALADWKSKKDKP